MPKVHLESDVSIILRDGTATSANVWREADGGQTPATLVRSPYTKRSNLRERAPITSVVDRWVQPARDECGEESRSQERATCWRRAARPDPPAGRRCAQRTPPPNRLGRVQQRSASVIVEIAESETGSSSTAGSGHKWSRAALACHVSRGPRVKGGQGVNASITAADARDSGEALDDVFGRLSGSQRPIRLRLCRFRR